MDAEKQQEVPRNPPAGPRRLSPTLAEVASEAGVSTASVSRILAGIGGAPATAERVRAAAARLGYRPPKAKRALQPHLSHTIGVIVSDIENPVMAILVRSIEEASRDKGYASLLCNANFDVASVMAHMALLEEHDVDGVIISVARLDARSSAALAHHRVPIALIDCAPIGVRLPTIASDNRLGGRLAIDHLLSLGHRDIGYIAPNRQLLAARDRILGAEDGMRWANQVGRLRIVESNRPDAEGGQRAMTIMLQKYPEVTGVFAWNDMLGIGALEAIRRAGLRVPDDISVVGFDDIPMAAYAHPPLTTVHQSFEEMGRWAFCQLHSEISSRDDGLDDGTGEVPQPSVIPVTLTERASTAPPRLK